MNSSSEYIVGIDLGTTNSCAAIYQNGSLKVLENSLGDRTTPSFVTFFNEKQVIVGQHAKKAAMKSSYVGISEIKRLIGRKFDDSNVQKSLKHLPYKVERAENNSIVVGSSLRKTPIEISTIILTKIKNDIETKLGKSHSCKAVITVPAYFNVTQREATLEAAKNAGFTVVKLLNEPTAAALSFLHLHQKKYSLYDNFLVFDFGGGTFDVAIIRKMESHFEIVAINGDSYLGGHDIDNLILDYTCNILREKYNCHIDPSDKKLLRRLRNKCESAKCTLTDLPETEIGLEGFFNDNKDIELTLSRQTFEELTNNLFKKTITIVEHCLKSCNISKQQITEVIMAGGSMRIPKLQQMLSEFFNGKKLNKFAQPDECIAEGAAIQAAMFSKHTEQKITDLIITDVTPLSIGILLISNLMSVCIKKHTTVPTFIEKVYNTVDYNQKTVEIDIYEGERADARKNRFLGTFTLENLTPAPPGECKIIVKMEIDHNGILTVTAKEQQKNNYKNLKVIYNNNYISDANVKNTTNDAENNKDEDETFTKFANEKEKHLNYCSKIISIVAPQKNEQSSMKSIYEYCAESFDKALALEVSEENKLITLTKEVRTKCDYLLGQTSRNASEGNIRAKPSIGSNYLKSI